MNSCASFPCGKDGESGEYLRTQDFTTFPHGFTSRAHWVAGILYEMLFKHMIVGFELNKSVLCLPLII